MTLDHLQELVIVISGVAHTTNHLVSLLHVFVDLFQCFVEEDAAVDGVVAQLGAGVYRVHRVDYFTLPLKEVDESDQLVFNIAQLEKCRRVVSVLLLCATTLFFVAGANIAKAVLDGLKVDGFVADSFCAEFFERICKPFGLCFVSVKEA